MAAFTDPNTLTTRNIMSCRAGMAFCQYLTVPFKQIKRQAYLGLTCKKPLDNLENERITTQGIL